MMTWQGPQDFSRLETLGTLTVRLLRLTVFDKINRGESQLRAHNITSELSEAYKKHAQAELQSLLPVKDKDFEFIKIEETKRSTF